MLPYIMECMDFPGVLQKSSAHYKHVAYKLGVILPIPSTVSNTPY
jgi:hypothetical protein